MNGEPLDERVFDDGPTLRLQSCLRLRKAGDQSGSRPAIVIAAIAWIPLALLATAHGDLFGAGEPGPFLRDFGVHARYLVAVPVLVLAECGYLAQLSRLAQHFLRSGLVIEPDRQRFAAAMASIRRWQNAPWAAIALVIAAYSILGAALWDLSLARVPVWHGVIRGSGREFSAAAWWHLTVSAPVLLVLLLGWLWRHCLWVRFLWSMSRLRLRLMPAHPDRIAGLRFVSDSITACAPFAFALGAIVAGMVANRTVNDGATLASCKYLVLGFVASLVALLVLPLLMFTRQLLSQWRRSVLEYDTMVTRSWHEFERAWSGRSHEQAASSQAATAVSQAFGLFGTVSKAYAMQFLPFDVRSVILLVVSALTPFVPVALMVAPVDQIVGNLARFVI